MNLLERTIAAVRLVGQATVEDIYPELEKHGYSRKQVLQALHRGVEKKRLRCQTVRRAGTGHRGGSLPSIYRLSGAEQSRPNPEPLPRPLTSVWDMAIVPPMLPSWPPEFEGARRFQLLGDPWEEGAAA